MKKDPSANDATIPQRSKFDLRNDLIEQANYGEITAEEAETEAVRLELGPFAKTPDPKDFDIMARPYWTLPMVIAWIAYRTSEAVTEWCDEYRQNCWHWIWKEWRDGPSGPVRKGYFLERWHNGTLEHLMLSDIHARSILDNYSPVKTVPQAEATLWQALLNNIKQATFYNHKTGERELIPAESWNDLICSKETSDEVVPKIYGVGREYASVIMSKEQVIHLWPPHQLKPSNELPKSIKPEGGGYMPLFCAAQWIATKGGTVEFDPAENEKWHNSFSELLARISANDISVTGVTDGERAPVEHYLFAGIRYSFPWDFESTFNLLDSKDLYLSVELYSQPHIN
jgi:hypothetical protein